MSLYRLNKTTQYSPLSAQKYEAVCSDILIPKIQLEKVIGAKKTPGCLFCLKMNSEGDYLASTTGKYTSNDYNNRSISLYSIFEILSCSKS